MNRVRFIIVLLLVLVATVVGSMLFWRNANDKQSDSNDSSGLIVGNNALYVAEQVPGDTVISSMVRLNKPGFLVIHENNTGFPGKVIGASNLLPAGENQNPTAVALSRVVEDGETIYAMLHLDNGDGIFKESEDAPAIDPVGNEPVMMMVFVSKDAGEPETINKN